MRDFEIELLTRHIERLHRSCRRLFRPFQLETCIMQTHEVQERHDDKWRNHPYHTDVRVNTKKFPMGEAQLAIEIAKHLALVVGKDDGEDSAGRQKIAIMPADEVALRACDIAEKMYAEFDARGWLLDLPAPREVVPEKKADEEAA